MRPVERHIELTSAKDQNEVAERLNGFFSAEQGRATASEGGLEVRGGSHLALRFFGVYLKPGRDRIPWKADVRWRSLDEGGGTAVELQIASAVGFGRANKRLRKECERLVDRLATGVIEVLSGS